MKNFKISKDLLIGRLGSSDKPSNYVIDKFCECLISSNISTSGMLLLGVFYKKDVKEYQSCFLLKIKIL